MLQPRSQYSQRRIGGPLNPPKPSLLKIIWRRSVVVCLLALATTMISWGAIFALVWLALIVGWTSAATALPFIWPFLSAVLATVVMGMLFFKSPEYQTNA